MPTAESSRRVARAVEQVEDNADRRTVLAADRTIFAAERTYAAWVRTGLASLAAGVGAKAALGEIIKRHDRGPRCLREAASNDPCW